MKVNYTHIIVALGEENLPRAVTKRIIEIINEAEEKEIAQRAPIMDVEKQEKIVEILFAFHEAQQSNVDKMTHYYDPQNPEIDKKIYVPSVRRALEMILDLFGYKIAPIE